MVCNTVIYLWNVDLLKTMKCFTNFLYADEDFLCADALLHSSFCGPCCVTGHTALSSFPDSMPGFTACHMSPATGDSVASITQRMI